MTLPQKSTPQQKFYSEDEDGQPAGPAVSLKSLQAAQDAEDNGHGEEYDLERASTTSSVPLGDMAGAGQNQHYQPKQDIICRLEHIREKDMKVELPFWSLKCIEKRSQTASSSLLMHPELKLWL